uniref:DNA 5'-3' helicase n=1 Tax=Laurenciella marilzae TaxID=1413812 RepID=A0A1Z1M1V3_9FLOR|nr:Replication helicase subunit [Laurenciella marilzae]ARW59872.1 Replication helicase subunit [Laurenciella marilzae]
MHIKKFIPQNYLAEEILLGSIIIYPNITTYIKDNVTKDFFFLESHEILYINLIDNINTNYNIAYFLYVLKSKKLLKKVGGLRKIINIMRQSQIFINSSNLNNYVNKLIHVLNFSYIKRLIIQYGHNIAKLGYISTIDNEYLYHKIISYLKYIEKEIIKNQQQNKNITSIKELISINLLKLKYPIIYKHINSRSNKNNIKFGFNNLDVITHGLPSNNLIIVAGRPSVGKTSFAINVAYNIFFYQSTSVCIFSLEMSTKEILNKFLCLSCHINIDKNNFTKLQKSEWKNIMTVCKKLIESNIYINDKTNVKIDYIEEITQNLNKRQNFHLIIIDYLQLIESSEISSQKLNRSQELGYITRKLKLLSQILKLPIIVLSQLNRNIEIRSNKEPILSDLKESGCIEYTNNINLSRLGHYINIKNINLTKFNFPYINNQTNNIVKKYNYKKKQQRKQIKKLNLSIKIITIIITKNSKLGLTHNHQYLSQASWKEINVSTKLSTIITNQEIIAYKNYIRQILLNKYSKTYDINFNDKYYFLCKEIIIHNSIEQDSDIIIMLNNTEKQDYNNTEKIIDIKVSKNRNGFTGHCQFLFTPETMKFSEFTNKNITNISYI